MKLKIAFRLFYSCVGIVFLTGALSAPAKSVVQNVKDKLAQALKEPLDRSEFPHHFEIQYRDKTWRALPDYTLQWDLQHQMEKLFKTHRPDYGAFVAMDAATGKILALVSHQQIGQPLGNLATRSTYPGASVFKIVTAAAAIDQGKIRPETTIKFQGSNHTLYKRNLTQVDNKWAREITVSEAFAKSINMVFAKIGLYFLTPQNLREYAERFFYNKPMNTDIPTEPGHFEIVGSDPFSVAELASGFNRTSTLSPLQGALMASSIVNHGISMAPYLIDSLSTENKTLVYKAAPQTVSKVMTPGSAIQMRKLMQETVRRGTSRKYFHTLLNKLPKNMEVGGKTGSLSGFTPRGKYDWFVGYAAMNNRKVGFAVLTIHQDVWRVRSSYVARLFIEQLAKDWKADEKNTKESE